MQLTPYLNFDGTCREAFTFYCDVLGGRIAMMMTNGESPVADQVPPGAGDRIMHARMEAPGVTLMGSDVPSTHYKKAAGMQISIGLADVAEAERLFARLSEGGAVAMPLQQTFWAKRFGLFTDRFGTPWMINCE